MPLCGAQRAGVGNREAGDGRQEADERRPESRKRAVASNLGVYPINDVKIAVSMGHANLSYSQLWHYNVSRIPLHA